jgi:hypothetical protein
MKILLNIKIQKMKTNSEHSRRELREEKELRDLNRRTPRVEPSEAFDTKPRNFKSNEDEAGYFARLAFKHRVQDPKQAF